MIKYPFTMISRLLFSLVFLLTIFSSEVKSQTINELYRKVNSTFNVNNDECLTFAKKLEKLSKKKSVDSALAMAYYVQASIYYDNKNYNKSIKYFEKELKIKEKTSEPDKIAESYYNLGSTCLKLNKNSKGKNYFNKSLEISSKINDKDLMYANHSALSQANEKLGNYRAALASLRYLNNEDQGEYNETIGLYQKKFFEQKQITKKKNTELKTVKKSYAETKEILDTTTTKLNITEQEKMSLEEDTLRKNLKINSLNFQKLLGEYDMKAKQEELKRQRQLTYLFIGGFVIIFILSGFLFKLFITKKKMNKELITQKEKVTKQNLEITQSIRYARRIQDAILPSEEMFKDNFSEYFIFYKPKNIVSGDFYFLRKINDYVVFAAVDCTGHGVPGAFMSMLGMAFLNDIVRQKEVTKASQILDLLRENVKQSLNQTGKKQEQKDGMDMAVCVINTKTNQLQFSGAHNPLIIIRNNELIEFKGDRMPVGIHRKEKGFSNHEYSLQKDDKLYVYSDGFADQLSEKDKSKYKSKRLKEFLLKTSGLPMYEQKEMLSQECISWKGNYKQIDDVVILGVKM